jgi:FlaG/FlaF family flagellin (archaellin)
MVNVCCVGAAAPLAATIWVSVNGAVKPAAEATPNRAQHKLSAVSTFAGVEIIEISQYVEIF